MFNETSVGVRCVKIHNQNYIAGNRPKRKIKATSKENINIEIARRISIVKYAFSSNITTSFHILLDSTLSECYFRLSKNESVS